MKRNLVCKRCECKVGQEETEKLCKPRKCKLCKDCKQKSLQLNKQTLLLRNKDSFLREKNSLRLKQNNPMKNEQVAEKVSKTLKAKFKSGQLKPLTDNPEILQKIIQNNKERIHSYQQRKQNSERMIENNPMFDKSTLDKRTKTFKQKVKSGQIVYKKGKQHHLWKGNRYFNDTVRCQLYSCWIKPCMQRDNFTCKKCGCKHDLQVHHLVTLRSMIQKVLIKYNIKRFNDVPSCEWQKYIDEILLMHRLQDGITLCSECHQKQDNKYHANSKNRKKSV